MRVPGRPDHIARPYRKNHRPEIVTPSNIVAILVALAASAGFGLVNAVGMTRIGIPSFIMTLAS